MSERLERHHPLFLGDRYEYDMRRSVSMFEPAVEALEDLLDHREGTASYSVKDGIVRRTLDVYGSSYGFHEGDEIIYSDLSQVRVVRAPLSTEAQVVVEHYRSGPLQQMASLVLKEFIGNSPYPFTHEYRFEAFAGGGAHATVTMNDVVRGSGTTSRAMTPYDFQTLVGDVERVAETIQQMVEPRVK